MPFSGTKFSTFMFDSAFNSACFCVQFSIKLVTYKFSTKLTSFSSAWNLAWNLANDQRQHNFTIIGQTSTHWFPLPYLVFDINCEHSLRRNIMRFETEKPHYNFRLPRRSSIFCETELKSIESAKRSGKISFIGCFSSLGFFFSCLSFMMQLHLVVCTF